MQQGKEEIVEDNFV